MRLPISRVEGITEGIVRSQEQPFTVYRRQDDNDSSYGPDDAEYTQLDDPRPLHVYGEDERVEIVSAGEVVEAAARGYARTSVDVREDDRIDYGSRRYEVEQVTPIYDGRGTHILDRLDLQRL